jgi:ABC-2 type transport system ATP-binding protein/lipopolysaccharide transport system ATP-binding protein
MNEAVILEHVEKHFKKYALKKNYSSFKERLVHFNWFENNPNKQHLEVLKDINLSVNKSTVVGMIGNNGSGKSTLLKLIAGIYKPDKGKVIVNGRVSTLIEVGAGFHPEFTGRENIFINGIILGLSKKEIKKRFDGIVAFAELEEFIDAPVRTYSTGMYMRLGFSVAVNVDPDILLIDEVLAVGDESFQKKCIDKITKFKSRGKTMIIVSHSMEMIKRLCDDVVLVKNGDLFKGKSIEDTINVYQLGR